MPECGARRVRFPAELVRAQATAQTVLAERLRIARELHDVVAHSIGIIAIQAGAGRRVFDARPAEARDALAAIEATSRETLSGLRRHAGTDRCLVSVRRADGQLSIEVTDRGRGAPASKVGAAGTGYGITGMRERAALLGGDFSAGPGPAGGFRVAARLPVPGPAR